MEANSYIAIAHRDLRSSKRNLSWGDCNLSVRLSQQAVEKLLKHQLEQTQDPSVIPFMRLHNLKKLYTELKLRCLNVPEINIDKLNTLTGYYFDVNYPGDNFEIVEQVEGERMYAFAEEVFAKLSELF